MRIGQTTRVEGVRLNKPAVIIIGALALVGVLATYLFASDQQDGEEMGGTGNGEPSREELNITPPKDKTLRLTVPKMKRIKNDEIPTGLSTDRPCSTTTPASTSSTQAGRGRKWPTST
jgi:hypothetical protein